MRLQSLAVSLSVFLIFLTPLEAYSGKKHKSGSSREQENCTEPVSSSQDLGCFCNGEGHLESLQILYTGDSCAASSHHQSTTGVQCSGDPKGAERVRILATTNESETHKQYAVSFDGEVSLDQAFHLNGTMTKHEKLSPTTYLYIYSLGGQLLQSVSFHTSCSQPLEIGDQFGSFVLQSGIRNSEILADGCGVCGGDGSSCVDCLGVPNGGAQVDACGVCNGNNACKDCEGTTNGSKTVDACGICGGDGSSCLDCEGVPFGTTNIDSCGVCGGNNTCVDCKGTTHGTAKLDSCGVCGGSNACLDCGGEACDCFGEIGGTAKVDSCGVCGGTDKCLDCAGTPFGTALLDACGECNGANTCLDCAGEPFGEAFVDRCGVCNGDGESCVNCTAVNLASVQGQLDGNGFAMKQLVLKAMKLFRRTGDRQARQHYKKNRKIALENYVSIWSLAYSYPGVSYQCDESPFCTDVSQVESHDAFRQSISRLDELMLTTNKMYASAKPKRQSRHHNKDLKRLVKRFDAQKAKALTLLNDIPLSISSCS